MVDLRLIGTGALMQELESRGVNHTGGGESQSKTRPIIEGQTMGLWSEAERSERAQQAANRVSVGLTLKNVEDAFTYHAWNPDQAEMGNVVREALVAAAKAILRVVPSGPDRDAALRKLREARMDANSAITHNGRF